MSALQQGKTAELLKRQIEAVLFIATDGASAQELASATGHTTAAVRKILNALRDDFSKSHGMEVVELGGKWFMTSAEDMSDTLEKFRVANESEHVRLTRASLETLAVIAYSQPVTRSEVESIRGVRCDRVIDTLLGYGLVRIAGRRKSTGSPLLYRTSTRFLEIFGLGAISDLPTVAELEDLRRRSAEVADSPVEPAQGETCENEGEVSDEAE